MAKEGLLSFKKSMYSLTAFGTSPDPPMLESENFSSFTRPLIATALR